MSLLKASELRHTGVLRKHRAGDAAQQSCFASRVTEEEKLAGAAFSIEGGAAFTLPLRLVL